MEEKKAPAAVKPESEKKMLLTKRASLTIGKTIYKKGVEYFYTKEAFSAIPKKYQDFFEVK